MDVQISSCYGFIIGVVYYTNLGIVAFEKGKPNIAKGNCNRYIRKDLGKNFMSYGFVSGNYTHVLEKVSEYFAKCLTKSMNE